MVFCSVAAVFTAVGASWGLHRTDSGLTNIESVLQDMATDMLAVSREGIGRAGEASSGRLLLSIARLSAVTRCIVFDAKSLDGFADLRVMGGRAGVVWTTTRASGLSQRREGRGTVI